MISTSLPTLRSRIRRSFLVIIAAYALLGFFLVSGVFISSGTTPKLLHRNYDSTAAADKMRRAWDALSNSTRYSQDTHAAWIQEFDAALKFEESNITETGEQEAVDDVRKIWNITKASSMVISADHFNRMHARLDEIVQLNEGGMFRLAHSNERLSKRILIGAVAYFFVTLLLATMFANGVANRLAQPLKHIAEVLRGKQKLGKELKLPEPTSLEVLILNHELKRLWKRLTQTNEFNVVELVEQKKKLETVLSSIEDALLVVNSEGVVSQSNENFATLVGVNLKDIIGQPWRDLSSVHENYIKLRDELHEEMSEGRELELFLGDHRRSYALRWRPIEPIKGQISGIVYLLHDFTEKRQRDRLRAEIIDLLSHELKTPLQSLGTASELLVKQKDAFSADTQLLVDTVAEDVDRIRAVAHEFVQVTQTHSKILKLKLEKLPISQLLPEWLKPFSLVARDKRVKLEFVHEGSNVIWVNVDSVKFPWVISNLVSNAIRFSPPEASVKITLGNKLDVVDIKVEDEGPGIPPEDRIRVFEPFFQSKTQSSDASRGLFGVGLTIAREVVEAHEGKIEYFPRSPHGSTFRIVLPLPA